MEARGRAPAFGRPGGRAMVTRRGEHEARADAGYLCFARSRFAPPIPYFSRQLLNAMIVDLPVGKEKMRKRRNLKEVEFRRWINKV